MTSDGEESWEYEAEVRVARSDDEAEKARSDYEEEEEESGSDDQQQQPGATRRVRKARTSTKWPVDKMIITIVDEGSMPS
jgi:hypothetical protein